MPSPIDNIPLPKMHPSGGLVAHKKECEWWPEEQSLKGMQIQLDKPKGNPSQHSETIQAAAVTNVNNTWLSAAQHFLTAYNNPYTNGGFGNARRESVGHISDAAERVRDDRVVFDTLPLAPEIREGLDIKHRDVLAAIALLSAQDTTNSEPRFRDGVFEAQKKRKTK